MILPLPSNLGFAYVSVPVWAWEPAQDPCAQPPDHPPAADGVDARNACADPAAAERTPDLRLVFKGYQWRSVAHWEQTPHRALERFLDNDAGEIAERGQRAARERREAESARLDALSQRTSLPPAPGEAR